MSQKPLAHVSQTVKDDLDWFHASITFAVKIGARARMSSKCVVTWVGNPSTKPQNRLEMKRRRGLARQKFHTNVGLPGARADEQNLE